ncbi:NAD(+) diphosphatase [Heliobacterium gestii]|uniref:NAD(+) diphosphatase n=1 Tax=Heliomicrobium gestii TaxID=2699 RepID=A0A845LGD7_HELGE|nr:NAD(+) diphosphatase [Heliomicrobium gestii]MBM7868293.1 NAD+ diphosphatase [Heliomicrobium gestii]MZP44484.1 NAD(+) diphosphatase [Heliomicrobium gestii]
MESRTGAGLSYDSVNTPYWFIFFDGKLLIKDVAGSVVIPSQGDMDAITAELTGACPIGLTCRSDCYVATLADGAPPRGYAFIDLRRLYGQIADSLFWTAIRALHIWTWLKKNHFCGCCASRLQMSSQEMALQCERCGHLVYPRISPAIIVAVTRGDQLLLARPHRVPAVSWHTVIAGFVEPGETLEECVRREVREEVGIEVDRIQYFGSQPWPFPDSLMVGFTAQYASGEITIDPREIIEADWFSVDNLPPLPASFSIAKRLIEWFVSTHRQTS